ncbi:MAG: LysR substrate-binding domain-containing protein, partial [Pseudomonadota bacterium]
GSVTRAAAELGRTHGAVSRQIRQLQETLNAELFERAGTGIRPTELGVAFQRDVAAGFDAIEAGVDTLRRALERNKVTVASSPSFAMRWLAPRLRSFYAEHPHVTVQLTMLSHVEDPPPPDLDILITWDSLSRSFEGRVDAASLADTEYALVCAPQATLDISGDRVRAAARIDHPMMPHAWPAWSAETGMMVEADEVLSFPHGYLIVEAAAAGRGVALLERRLVADDLAEGRLIAPCGWIERPGGLVAICPPDRRRIASVRTFLDWLIAEAAKE